MNSLSLIRVAKLAVTNFWRNGWLSLASTIVIAITIFIIGSVLIQNAVVNQTTQGIREKLDLEIYFNDDVAEADILELQKLIANRNDVKSVEYISKERALALWQEKPTSTKIKGLVTQKNNPLPRSLSIKTYEPEKLGLVANVFKAPQYEGKVRRISFEDNQQIINNLIASTGAINRNGLALTIIFIALSFILIYNTTKIIIISRRREIEIMRLVGATESFVRLPFLLEAALFGLMGVVLALPALFLFLKYDLANSNPIVSITKFLAPDMLAFFTNNFWWIALLLMLVGVALSVSMSYFAVKKYIQI